MNPLSYRNIARHELIGLDVIVINSYHSGYLGISGQVIDETRNTILISDSVGVKRVPKSVAKFRFILPDNSFVEINGKEIVGRPIERIKKGFTANNKKRR